VRCGLKIVHKDQSAIVEEWSTLKYGKEFGVYKTTLINALADEVRSAEVGPA